MKKILIGLASISFLSLFLTSCTKSGPDDTNLKPTIEIISTSPEIVSAEVCEEMHDNVIIASPGDTLELKMRFSDDHELSQYKFEIHANPDCHGHGERPLGDWSVNGTGELGGNKVEKTFSIPISVTADLTQYHIEMQLIDKSGMEAEELEINLLLQ